MIQEAYNQLDAGHLNPEEELKFTQRLKLHSYEYKHHIRTGILAKLLGRDKGDLVHWYETYEDEYVKSKQSWKRKRSYSVKPENLNLDEYKKLLLDKLKDTLEITGFKIDDLVQYPLHATAVSIDKFGQMH
jgi:hypothetical protein